MHSNGPQAKLVFPDVRQAYYVVLYSYGPPKPFFWGRSFFFSGLMAGPTYQPSVRHSNPDASLVSGHEKKNGTPKLQAKFDIRSLF